MAFVGLNLITCLLLIQKKDAILWGMDPTFCPHNPHVLEFASDSPLWLLFESKSKLPLMGLSISLIDIETTKSDIAIYNVPIDDTPQHTITLLEVLLRLLKSLHAAVCIFSMFVYG